MLHGNDVLAIQRHLKTFLDKVAANSAMADLNTTRLDGRQSSEDDLRTAVGSMPFLAERRLVIVTHPLAKYGSDAGKKRYQALMESVPESTLLVLVFEDTLERGKWSSLIATHWLHKWLAKSGEGARYVLCALPDAGKMPEWIRKEAQRQGGQFSPEAARALLAHVDNDTLRASQEINKLLNYVDCKRPVEVEDVEELTAFKGAGNIFAMTDELGAGNSKAALASLHRLLEEEDVFKLFGNIIRQFRLLIQARELMDEGRAHLLAQELRIPSFAADKYVAQARRFQMRQLEAIYHRILEIDEAIKTGQMPAELALDLFVTEVARE